MTILPQYAVRPQATDAYRFASAALNLGWAHAEPVAPGKHLAMVAELGIATQRIPVRFVEHAPGVSDFLAVLEQHMAASAGFEQYVVLEGFSAQARNAFRLRMVCVAERCFHVGAYDDYLMWLTERLGVLAKVSPNSPVRALLEPLLTLPVRKVAGLADTKGDYAGSKIQPSFELGAWGVQAVETLLRRGFSPKSVLNVELDKFWQAKDVDLQVKPNLADAKSWLSVEVKAEDYASGRMTLERFGNLTRLSPGWMEYSEADVLISCMRPSGDVVITDFQLLQAWYRENQDNPKLLMMRQGRASGQKYKSLVYLADIAKVLQVVPNSVHLNLGPWLPRFYFGFTEAPMAVGEGVTLTPPLASL